MVCTLFACPNQLLLFFFFFFPNFVVLKFWQFFSQNLTKIGLFFSLISWKNPIFFVVAQKKKCWTPRPQTWNIEHHTMRLVKYHHMGRSLWVTQIKVHNISLLIPFWKSCCIFNSTNSMSNYLKRELCSNYNLHTIIGHSEPETMCANCYD